MLNTRLIKSIHNEINKKPRKKKEKEIFELPKQYTKGLTKKEAKEKTENVKKTRELIKEGKKKEARELAKKRPTTKDTKKSTFTMRFKKKFPNTKPETKEFENKTGIPLKAQKDIIKRGMGAYLSAGSRASVSSPRQWGIARLYSFYFNKGRTFDTDLIKKYNITFK